MNRLIRCSEISTSNQVTAPRLTDQPIESLPIAQRPCTAVPVWALTCAPVPGENAPRPEEAPCVSRGGYASTPLRRSLALSHADAHTGRQGDECAVAATARPKINPPPLDSGGFLDVAVLCFCRLGFAVCFKFRFCRFGFASSICGKAVAGPSDYAD